ncbi:uncharacterized mitochondrial protein-like protein [Tanacetum coccineum]
MEEDAEKEELKGFLDIIPREEVPIEVESISTKFPIVDWKTCVLTETFMYYQVFRGDGSSKNYKILSEMLEDFDRLDVEELYRLVKERYSASRPEGFDLMLWGDLHTLFEPDEDDEIWKDQHEYNLISWRLCDFCGIHILLMENGLAIHMLTEKKYPLSQEMISKMLKKKLEVDHESSQAIELLRIDQGVGSTSGIRACALRNFDLGKMELENSQNNALAKLPMLKLGEYEMWEIRIKQYFQIQDYALWEVIENGNSWVPIPVTTPESGPSTALKMTVPSTTEEKICKKNDVKARSLLLMALPNEHQLTFNQYVDAQSMFVAIKARFGGNEATKRTQKALLKQQYENFNASSSESLDSIFNRLQKLVSRLAILGVVTPPEDLNVKFLRSLPSEWDTHVVVWMNKPDFDTMGLDDLYNNFKIVKQKVKKSTADNNDDKNLAFLTTSTILETGTSKLRDATVYAFLSTQPQGSQLVHEDLEQLHDDDLEEMDLKWNMALLSMRARKFYQRTRRKIIIDGSSTAGYDKSKVECFNCHKMGHFARECRAPRNGAGFDWSDMAEDEIQANMALMAFTDSKTELEKVKEEKEGFEFKIAKFEKSSKDLDALLASQVTDKSKKGFGYNAVPSPHPLILNRPTPLDLSYLGLEEFKQPEVNEYGPRDSSLKPTTVCDRESDNSKENTDDSLTQQPKTVTETSSVMSPLKVSDDEEEVEPIPKEEKKTVVPTATKKESVKTVKPSRMSVRSNSTLNDKGFVDSDAQGTNVLETIPVSSDFKTRRDGVYVTFGRGANGGRITGKGIQGVSKSSTSSQQDQDCIVMPIWKDASYFDDVSLKSVADAQIQDQDGTHDRLQFSKCTAVPEVNTATPEDLMGPIPTTKDTQVEDQEIELGNISPSYAFRFLVVPFMRKDSPEPTYSLLHDFLTQEEQRKFLKLSYQPKDVKSAFLYGQIEEEVYVCQPPGFEDPDHLNKMTFNFGSTKKELCDEFEKLMKDKFQMSSMGELTFFLGLQVQQKKNGIFISQDKYVHEILRKFNYTDVKSASTPTDLKSLWVKDADVGMIVQVSPKTSHLLAAKRIFRYLKGKPSLGLWYSKDSPLELIAYTDSDYAGATLDRKSTTGGCQFLETVF